MLVIFIGFQKALGITETYHGHIENDKVHNLLTNFTLVLKVKNFENVLVEFFVSRSAEIHGPSIKLYEVDLLVSLLT